MKLINKVCLILGICLINIGYIYSQSKPIPIKWENVKHMKLTGKTVLKSSKYGYNNSMTSCQVGQGGINAVQYVEHELKSSNAVYGFGLFSENYTSSVDRAQYFFIIKNNGSIGAYDFGPGGTSRFTSYNVGDKLRIERNGNIIRFKRNNYVLLTLSNVNPSVDFKVKFNLLSKDLPVDANMITNFSCDYISNSIDPTKNWTETTVYDGLGDRDCNILSESRTYFDEMGRPMQTQTRLKTEDEVWAAETKYDAFGRAVLNTLAAPTKDQTITYQDDFFNGLYSKPYNWEDDFDKGFDQYLTNPGLKNSYGGVNRPKSVESSNPGTLGWYYSHNNTDEVNTPTTSYPYSRVEYSLLTGAQRRTSNVGEAHKMGAGHESSVYPMRVSEFHELYTMFGAGAHPYNVVLKYDSDDDGAIGKIDYTGSTNPTTYTDAVMKNKIVKAISIDADGKQTVSFTDLDGNELAVCLSGSVNGTNVHEQKVSANIPIGQFRDIHIPEGCTGSNFINVVAQGKTCGNSGISGIIKYEIYDLKTDALINLPMHALPAGFYRIVNTGKFCVRVNYTLNYHNFSLGIYNPLKQLIASVPPNGIDYSRCNDPGNTKAINFWHVTAINSPNVGTGAGSVPLHKQLSLFKYNKAELTEWSQTPDAGRTHYAYSKDGKLRFSQNQKQRNSNQFSYNNYDMNGRLIESGVYRRGTSNSDGNCRYFFPHETPFLVYGDFVVTNSIVVENDFNPGCNGRWLSEQVFTTYDVSVSGSGRTQRFTMGKVSKTTDGKSSTWYSYDPEGRVKWMAKKVYGMGGIRFTDMTYDLLGNVTQVEYQKDKPDQFIHHYSYNETGKVQSSATEDAWGNVEVQTEYDYYQDGTVKSVELGDGLQEMNYSYTIHGWLKGINMDEMSHASASGKVFSMTLDYYNGDYSPAGGGYVGLQTNTLNDESHTGRISMVRWKTNATVTGLGNMSGYFAYNLSYNHRDELTNAQFGNITQVNLPKLKMAFSSLPTQDYLISGLDYDLNGNIQHLNRKGANGVNIDNLAYHYINQSNKLSRIQDGGVGTNFGDLKNQSNSNYTYNVIGELTRDNSENVKMIYDSRGKVTAVKNKTTNKYKARYFYDENGQRIRKMTYDNNGTLVKNTFYVFGPQGLQSIYEYPAGGSLAQKELPIYGGSRIGVAYVGMITNALDYSYELKDHLGNVRAVIRDATPTTSTTTLEVTYYADYYPFGWTMPGRNGGTSYRYAYQGQEKDPETGWEAFELRMYDGRVGRWMTTDPYGQYHSPYLAMGNNPLNMIDPDGGFSIPRQDPPSAIPASSIESTTFDAWKILQAIDIIDVLDGLDIDNPDLRSDIERMTGSQEHWLNSSYWNSEDVTGKMYDHHYLDFTDASVGLLLLADKGTEQIIEVIPSSKTVVERVFINQETGEVLGVNVGGKISAKGFELELSGNKTTKNNSIKIVEKTRTTTYTTTTEMVRVDAYMRITVSYDRVNLWPGDTTRTGLSNRSVGSLVYRRVSAPVKTTVISE